MITLRPYQHEAVDWVRRKRHVLIGDDVGLGKSLEAIAAVEAVDAYPALIVCPAFLRPLWFSNLPSWIAAARNEEQYNGDPAIGEMVSSNGFTFLKQLPKRSILLTNYETLVRRDTKEPPEPGFTFDPPQKKKKGPFLSPLAEALIAHGLKSIIVDESSYVKSSKSKRTRAIRSIARHCEYRILLSATAVKNRPQELISQLEILGLLDRFGGSWAFLQQFCDARKDAFGYWDFTGASNLPELNRRLRETCYIRRTKDTVQQELPGKTRVVVPLPISNRAEYERAESDVIAWIRSKHGLEAADRATRAETLVRINALRKLAAEGKMDAILEWIQTLWDAEEKVVSFVYHHEFAKELQKHFDSRNCGLTVDRIMGDVIPERRAEIVKWFNDSSHVQNLIVGVEAGGLGIDLTGASNCAFMELGWTPTDIEQAEGRLHRFGQKKPVTSYFLIGKGTIEESIYRLLCEKEITVRAVLDMPDRFVSPDLTVAALAAEQMAMEVGRQLAKEKA